jgi:hypothetical protein
MADDRPFTTPGFRLPPRQPKPGELLFEFVRASDRASIRCELHFHGDHFGAAWEARFIDHGQFWFSRSAFQTKALAVQWAELERQAIEKDGAFRDSRGSCSSCRR